MPDPGLPGGDMSSCIDYFQDEEDMDEDSAAALCESLKQEENSDNGDPEELLAAIQQGAGLISDVSVDFNSAVDVPAVNSKWVMMKSDADGYDTKVTGQLVFKQDSDADKRISYAPAMIPREPDKEGDVVPTPVVEAAAHDYLANDGEVDTDHSLVDGKGTVVESWIEPEERTWDLPDGGSETYPAGTWMVGIKWEAEPWQRIKNGELTGLSIYGMADHVPLGKAADCGCATTAKELTVPFADEVIVDLVYGAKRAAEKAAAEMGMGEEAHARVLDGDDVWTPGPDHETYVDVYNEIAEGDREMASAKQDEDPCWEGYTMVGTDENGDPRCVPDDEVPDADFSGSLTPAETRKTADSHKGDATESAGMGDATTDSETDDGPTIETVAASVDELAAQLTTVKEAVETDKQDAREAAAILAEEYGLDGPEAVLDAVDAKANGEDDEEMDEDDDEEEDVDVNVEASTEKRVDDANLEKGGDAKSTAQKGITDDETPTGDLSYAAAVEKYGGDS